MRWKTQSGNVVSSHSSACGRSSLTTKLWIDSRSWSCSSVKMKCLREPAWSGFRTSVAAMPEPYLAAAAKVNSGTSHFPPGPCGVASCGASCRACPSPCCRAAPRRRAGRGRAGQPDHDDRPRRLPRRDGARDPLGPLRWRPPGTVGPDRARPEHVRDLRDRAARRHAPLAPGGQHRLEGQADRPRPLRLPDRRHRPRGRAAVARSAPRPRQRAGGLRAARRHVEPGRYLVVVDNVCSRDADRGRPAAAELRDRQPTSRTRTTSRAP